MGHSVDRKGYRTPADRQKGHSQRLGVGHSKRFLTLAGFSRLRNRVLGRVFRELNLIEQWGSGIQRMFGICERQGLKLPEIIELNNQFRVTLFSKRVKKVKQLPWGEILVKYLKKEKVITTKIAASIWDISARAARDRLKILQDEGVLQRIATYKKDPKAIFVLNE